MAILGAIKEWINGKRIPGSPGIDCVRATATTYAEPVVLLVTTEGEFQFTTAGGQSRTLTLPVGLFPVYISAITDLGSGAAIAIYQ